MAVLTGWSLIKELKLLVHMGNLYIDTKIQVFWSMTLPQSWSYIVFLTSSLVNKKKFPWC